MPPPKPAGLFGRKGLDANDADGDGDLDGDGVADVGDDGLALDAKKQQDARHDGGSDALTGTDNEANMKRMQEVYGEHYEDFKRHRVWYQVMAFAPRPKLKDFQDLPSFRHEVEHLDAAALMTVRDGQMLGERIICRFQACQGKLDGQQSKVHIPGVGDVNVTLLASNNIMLHGVHNVPVLSLGILPWGTRPLERRVLVPEAVDEVVFDFPALLMPKKAEIMGKEVQDRKTAKSDAKEAQAKLGEVVSSEGGAAQISVKAGTKVVDYLQRDCVTTTVTIMSKEHLKGKAEIEKREKEEERKRQGGCCRKPQDQVVDKKGPKSPQAKRKILKKQAHLSLPKTAGGDDVEAAATGDEGGGDDSKAGLFDELQQFKHHGHRTTEVIAVPKLARFDVAWPTQAAAGASGVGPFELNLPAIKPGVHLPEDILSIIPTPKPNSALSTEARRYQFGWVLVELPPCDSNSYKVYMRLPAYISHKSRALAMLDPKDLASPFNTNLPKEGLDLAEGPSDAGAGGSSSSSAAPVASSGGDSSALKQQVRCYY